MKLVGKEIFRSSNKEWSRSGLRKYTKTFAAFIVSAKVIRMDDREAISCDESFQIREKIRYSRGENRIRSRWRVK